MTRRANRKRTAARSETERHGSAAQSVLVIDDEPGIREVVRLILESQGFDVLLAEDAAEARQVIARSSPQAILLDIVLPGEDGLSLCRALKRDPRTARIPVLLITGRVRRTDMDLALAAGADGLVTKPFDEREVIDWLKDAAAAA